MNGLLNINDLDPIRRHLPASERPKVSQRYSSFQVELLECIVWTVVCGLPKFWLCGYSFKLACIFKDWSALFLFALGNERTLVTCKAMEKPLKSWKNQCQFFCHVTSVFHWKIFATVFLCFIASKCHGYVNIVNWHRWHSVAYTVKHSLFVRILFLYARLVGTYYGMARASVRPSVCPQSL